MKNKINTKLVGVLFILIVNFSSYSQQPSQVISDTLQYILNHSLPTNFQKSGAVMSVVVPGKWSWNSLTGYAISGTTNGQSETIANPTDLFRVGSITKMMIATCILKLHENGSLNIEDPISNYLRSTLVNDTINSSGIVKIRHLLNHTSGIANSGDNQTCQMDVLNNPTGSHSLEDAIYCGTSQGEIFEPEFAWAYSNTNYSILAMIINNVTGMDYRDYLNQTIFQPLNLTNTYIPTTNEITNSHMGCYWNIGSWIDLTIINSTTYSGWADVVSNSNDLIQFYIGLRNGTIINSTSFGLMQTMFPGTYDYGLGYDHYTFSGVNYDGHYGEVANTSGLFFANTTSQNAPNGYYIAYNFNTQGADMINKIDLPVFNLLNSGSLNGLSTLVESKINVYPNPVSDFLTINNNENSIDSVLIFDELGNLVLHKSIEINSSIIQLDCTSLRNGIYILQIASNHQIERQKLTVK